MATKPLSKLTKREQVIEFCRRYRIDCDKRMDGDIIILSSKDNNWFDVFESWVDAQLFLLNAKLDKEISNKKFMWE